MHTLVHLRCSRDSDSLTRCRQLTGVPLECARVSAWEQVRAGLVFEAIDLAGAERELDAAEQGGRKVGFEVGVGEIGDSSGMAVER